MLLRALLESPGLGLRLLCGEESLDRRVTGVFTTDLLDPRRYLAGGEVVLTGLMWRRGPRDSETFARALAEAGVAALAAGDAALGSVPADLVNACRRRGLPLLEVPVDVSFAAITERVLASNMPNAGFGPLARRARLLARAGARDAETGLSAEVMAAVFAVAAREHGLAGWVVSSAGRLVAAADEVPGERLLAALAAGCLGAAGFPAAVTVDGAPYSLFQEAGQAGRGLADWFAAFQGDSSDWDDGRREIAAELAGLAAACQSQREESLRPLRRCADELLRRLLGWRGEAAEPRELAAAMRRCGLSPQRRGPVVVAAALAGVPQGAQAARRVLEEALPGAAVGACGDEAVAFANVPPTAAAAGLAAAAAAVRDGRPGAGLSFGFCGPGRPSGADAGPGPAAGAGAALRQAVGEARQARRLAALPGGARVVDSAQLGSHELLLALAPEEARQAFRDAALGPLLAYDRAHGAELLHTLRVFLNCSGSWTRAARQLYVHVNSLRYRIRRIEELTGRDLGRLPDQADLLAAVRLGPSAAEDEGPDPAGP